MKLSAKHLDAFQRDGVVPLGRVLSDSKVGEARAGRISPITRPNAGRGRLVLHDELAAPFSSGLTVHPSPRLAIAQDGDELIEDPY